MSGAHRILGPAFVAGLAALFLGGCASGPPIGPAPDPTSLAYVDELEVDFSQMEQTSSGLWIQELTVGVGSTASRGDRVWIHFVGFLPDGTPIDSSLGGDPFTFELGSSAVIRGWNEGVLGMKVGGRRRFVIRPGLAYGRNGRRGVVPPQSVLVFEIQLVDAN